MFLQRKEIEFSLMMLKINIKVMEDIIPKYFKYFEDVRHQFGNIIIKHFNSYSDGGYDAEGLPQSLISDFYIITKHIDISEYTLHHYHSEKWFGGEPEEETYFYHEGSNGLRKNLHPSNKHLYRILKGKIDKNKDPELYDIISNIIDHNI